jgi:hypothetical protein
MNNKESKPNLFKVICQISYTLAMIIATLYGLYEKKYIISGLALILSVGYTNMSIRILKKYISNKHSFSSK